MKRRLKINCGIIFIATLLIAIFPFIFLRREQAGLLDEVAEIFGIAFILLGQIFRVSGRGYKSAHSQEGSALIQSGPYALVRNPMYLGILFIGLGMILVLFNWWAAAAFLLVFTVRYVLLIFKEEKKLLSVFPKDYPDYIKRVPRLLPSLTALFKQDVGEYLPLKLSWLKKEIGPILTVLLVTLFLESWEDIGSEGVNIYFREVIAILVIIILFAGLVGYLSIRTNGAEKDFPNKGKTAL